MFRWRAALNLDCIWYQMCKRRGWTGLRREEDEEKEEELKVEENEDVVDGGLPPLCSWAQHFQQCLRLRRAWRGGGRRVRLILSWSSRVVV